MSARERTIPISRPAFAEPVPSQPSPHRFRVVIDAGIFITLGSLLVGGGMAWQTFLDQGKHLADHDQEIRELTQIQQQQQLTLAALNQNVSDIKESLTSGNRR